MRKFGLIIGFLACLCFAFEAQAKQKTSEEFVGAYVGMGVSFNSTFNFGFKLRYLKYFPFGFEFVNMAPYGTEIVFPLHLIHHPNFKWHVILPFTGFHIPWMKTRMSVDWLKRQKDVDLIIGTGFEVQLKAPKDFGFSYVSINLDWRMIAPSPVWVLPNFGDYGRKIYRDSAKEGQIWFGITFWR